MALFYAPPPPDSSHGPWRWPGSGAVCSAAQLTKLAPVSFAAAVALAIGSWVGPAGAIATPASNDLAPAEPELRQTTQLASVSIILGDRPRPQRLHRSRVYPHSSVNRGVVLQGDGFSIRLGGDGDSGSSLYYSNPSHHPAYRQHFYRHPASRLHLPSRYGNNHFLGGDRSFDHLPNRQRFQREQYRLQRSYYHQYRLRKKD